MRDLLLLLVVFGSLPMILVQPFLGLLMYSWLAYMRPHDMVWGDIPQISLIVALATLAGLVLSTGRERWLSMKAPTVLLIAFGVWVSLSGMTAMDPELSRVWVVRLTKVLLISVLTTGLVQSHYRFRVLYLVIAFSIGFLGFKYGLYSLVRGGAQITNGPGGFFPDNNGFALALCMGIPLLVGAAHTESRASMRAVAMLLAVFSAAAVIFTFSRGGLITLTVVAVIILARAGRPLAVGLVVAIALAGLIVSTSDEFQQSYLDRASTISDYEEDASAMGRVQEWGTALRIFSDYPIFGVGPDNLQIARPFYVLDGSVYKTTHNSFLQVLVACGLPGLLLFVAALTISLRGLSKLRKGRYEPWVREYASMIQCSLVAYLVGGMFLDGGYFDLTYHLIAIAVSLELAAQAVQPEISDRQTIGSSHAQQWWQDSPEAGKLLS